MATLTIRVDDNLRDALERVARDRGTTVSGLIRVSIARSLGQTSDAPKFRTPRTLTAVERRTLSNQHHILADTASDDSTARHHRRRAEILEAGFTAEYEDEFLDIEPELTPADCELVWDILDMYRVLRTSMQRAEPDTVADIPTYVVEFAGFDGNDAYESHLRRYAQHLIADDRWDDLADFFDDHHDRGNSHTKLLHAYKRMLTVFKPIWATKLQERGTSYELAAEELHQIADAWTHPD